MVAISGRGHENPAPENVDVFASWSSPSGLQDAGDTPSLLSAVCPHSSIFQQVYCLSRLQEAGLGGGASGYLSQILSRPRD